MQRPDNRSAAQPASGHRKRAPKPLAEEVIQTSFRLPRSRWKKLQELSIEERASVQSIIVRALEAEFAKHGITF